MTAGINFVVKRDDFRTCEFVDGEGSDAKLEPGQVQLRIPKFAFTANNVTYAVYGDRMGYWRFFPTNEGWGRVPVWGFGEVTQSANEGIQPGQLFYGFFPMSSYVTMLAKPNSAGFRDVASHREQLPGAYNQYFLTASDPLYDPIHENELMILRPLFITSFLAGDYLAEKNFFGARAIIISSASSKTAYGLAFLLSHAEPKLEVIGLTSSRNREFAEGLSCYDRVVSYDEIESLPRGLPSGYVDIAGSVPVRSALHQYFAGDLVHSMAVGDTHWEEDKSQAALAGEQEFFFAPTWLAQRAQDWGTEGFAQRFAEAWKAFVGPLSSWMKVVEETGQEAVKRVFLEHLEGRADPAIGNVLSL